MGLSKEISLKDKITNLKLSTDTLLTLPDYFELENGWKRKELLLHLWTWDVEYIRLCKKKIAKKLKGFKFEYEELGMSYTAWNEHIMETHRNLSEEEIEKRFIKDREKLVALFEKLKDTPEIKVPKNEYLTTQILNLWTHDKMHLEAGGVAIHFKG